MCTYWHWKSQNISWIALQLVLAWQQAFCGFVRNYQYRCCPWWRKFTLLFVQVWSRQLKRKPPLAANPHLLSTDTFGASLENLNKWINAAINTKSWFCLSTNCLLDWTPPPWRVLLSNYCHRCNQSMQENRLCNIITRFCLSFENECLRIGSWE